LFDYNVSLFYFHVVLLICKNIDKNNTLLKGAFYN